ncbi:NRPS condensation-like uncharacterized protein [Anaerosolibacter carboniphilus]|uniref:NRPS condensation-like uncharacterized protein n=1 Tax=Anaerosolibacter carboniphilus TaxID=1417629 RepID=A0A841KWF2_9FIRM|nr:condensation domain-containing protein [Anaerosolibacter carboniphilus]MBB6217964.1 NRPS condensation-like uncharacterized protein [Anaerosolibacter carboniphilus]
MMQLNGIQNSYEANGQDCFNYIARYGISNVQIQGVIEFKDRINSILLQQAVRLSIDVEPILGCRFVENEKKAYWERFKNIDEITWYTYEESEDKDKAINDFLTDPLGLDGQQQVQVKLIHSSKGSTICIKVNHACSDAGGVKQYLYLLSELYTRLEDDSKYRPLLVESRRDAKYYFDSLGIEEPMALFNPQQGSQQPTWAFPYHGLELSEMHIETLRFSPENFKRISTFAREKQVTINTMILTAFYRSMFDMLMPEQDEEMEIYVTTDLRKSVPEDKKQTICNLSSMMNVRIARIEEESIEKTLQRVAKAVDMLKSKDAGLSTAVMFEALGKIEYSHCLQILQGARKQAIESKKSSPLLSNIGVISILRFGNIDANDAYIVTPSMYAPGFMLGVSSYKNTLTLVVSYYEPSTRKEDVEQLLNRIREELEAVDKK